MKQGKILGLALNVVNIVLIVLCVFFFLRMDRTAPKLKFYAGDLTYVSGMDKARLLEGITAYDSHDGDITNRIVIEKMIVNEEEGTLIVFYAVSDQAGNVTKASREFEARILKENREAAINEIKEAGIEAELDATAEAGNAEGNENAQSEGETETAEESPTSSASPVSSASPTPTITPTPTAEPTQQPVEPTQQSAEQVSQPEPARPTEAPAGVPAFTLKVSEIKTQVGVKLALVDVIGKLSDDKDSYETLFHNIQISKYDVNTPGRYQVTLVTEDSDGNQSQTLPLTVIVE